VADLAPSLAGYLYFIRNNSLPIPTAALPDDSPWIRWTYEFAIQWVNEGLKGWTGAPIGATPMYALAVYNLGVDRLANWAPDVPPNTLFSDARNKYKLDSFVAGVVQSASDNGTGDSLLVPKFFEDITLFDLQTLKTPWGRLYMSIAQQYGPTIWGLS
jgi:hypothetical protein